MTTASSARTETDLLSVLLKPKPTLFVDSSAPVGAWKDCWDMFIYQIPAMLKNNESWFYYHRGSKQTCCGTDALIQREFLSLEAQGLKLCDDSKVNALGLYALIPHPKKKKTALRCDLTFRRYLGEVDEDGDAIGQGLCPLLWGIGGMGDGLTYMNVKITEVPLPKKMIQVAYDMVNRKWSVAA